MHRGLACQTDETPDARELYAARVEGCDDCEPVGELTRLVQAALGADAQRKPPLALVPALDRQLGRA